AHDTRRTTFSASCASLWPSAENLFSLFFKLFTFDCELRDGVRQLFFRNDLYNEFSFARTVKFAEENSLPPSQHQPATLDKHDLAAAHEHGFDVRIRVAFTMPIRA